MIGGIIYMRNDTLITPPNASIQDQDKDQDKDTFKEQSQKAAIMIWSQDCCTNNLRKITIKSPPECYNNILETS